MATESIGKTVHMDNEFADRFIAAMEEMEKNPPPPNTTKIRWATPEDTERITKALCRKYGYAE